MLPPIFFHYFPKPLSYARALSLQEKIYELQLLQRRSSSHKDYLLLLQHRPVYTSGRRQTETIIRGERARLTSVGADFVTTARGGELTYHGPGQIIGYPLLDLSRSSPPMPIREYVCRIEKTLQAHLRERHGIKHVPLGHTGVFLDENTKVASIGVQVRHRLTTHGFSLNVTTEPRPWFDQIIACGLADVKAGSISAAKGTNVQVDDEIPQLVDTFGRLFGREMRQLDLKGDGEIGEAISQVDQEASLLGECPTSPRI